MLNRLIFLKLYIKALSRFNKIIYNNASLFFYNYNLTFNFFIRILVSLSPLGNIIIRDINKYLKKFKLSYFVKVKNRLNTLAF